MKTQFLIHARNRNSQQPHSHFFSHFFERHRNFIRPSRPTPPYCLRETASTSSSSSRLHFVVVVSGHPLPSSSSSLVLASPPPVHLPVVLHLPGHRPRPSSRLLPLHLADSLVVLHRASSLCISLVTGRPASRLLPLHLADSLVVLHRASSLCIAPPPSASRLLPLHLPGRWSSCIASPPSASRRLAGRPASRLPLHRASSLCISLVADRRAAPGPCAGLLAGLGIAPWSAKKVIDWKLGTDSPIDLDAFELQSVG
ncbi:hypothetical protein Syun_022775 [Stephania yunnanensis]|uniref:Uncharacterized protein n=1 Tax=Stephania yunnanensis TaxID=152371 RepID=A0AAP0FLP8_9MAGN